MLLGLVESPYGLLYLQNIFTIYMNFEWDHNKNRENIRKHGIDFKDVTKMFRGPMLILPDARRDYGEDRWIGLGWLGPVVAVVAFVEKPGGVVRIISARKAARHEENQFKKAITH